MCRFLVEFNEGGLAHFKGLNQVGATLIKFQGFLLDFVWLDFYYEAKRAEMVLDVFNAINTKNFLVFSQCEHMVLKAICRLRLIFFNLQALFVNERDCVDQTG